MTAARARLTGFLRTRIQAVLSPRADLQTSARSEIQAVVNQLDFTVRDLTHTRTALDGLAAELDARTGPFHGGMSIHQAWTRHPGAPTVFARHHLPSCDGCAVRFDESLHEAASAYGIDLPQLLEELNAVLDET